MAVYKVARNLVKEAVLGQTGNGGQKLNTSVVALCRDVLGPHGCADVFDEVVASRSHDEEWKQALCSLGRRGEHALSVLFRRACVSHEQGLVTGSQEGSADDDPYGFVHLPAVPLPQPSLWDLWVANPDVWVVAGFLFVGLLLLVVVTFALVNARFRRRDDVPRNDPIT